MKRISSTIIVLLLSIYFFPSYAQLTHTGRGMYVNGFFSTAINGSGQSIINSATSILGVTTKENELLQFAKDHHITYLTLLGTHNIFGNATWESLLCSFIDKAKNTYCVELIGVSNSCADAFNDVTLFSGLPQTPNYPLPQSMQSHPLSFVQQTHNPGTFMFARAESGKLFLRASDFNSVCTNKIDVFVTEYEWWNGVGHADNCTEETGVIVEDKWIRFQFYTNDLNIIRDDYNDANSHTVFTEAYIGFLDNEEIPLEQNSSVVAAFIDGQYTDAYGNPNIRRYDRINPHYYYRDADVYNDFNSTGYYVTRFVELCKNPTNNLTNVHPIFSTEYYAWSGGTSNYLGYWFTSNIDNNYFTAEKIWYDDWLADNDPDVKHPTRGNVVTPGGAQWFTSGQMINHVDRPLLFTATNNPICIQTGGTGQFDFNYLGPIEDGLSYKFYITDAGTSNIRCGNTNSKIWDPYNIITNSGIDLNSALGSCALPEGDYDAQLELTYSTGCTYIVPVVPISITTTPHIVALTPIVNCLGNPIFLQASSSGSGTTNYQWRIGTTNSGTNSPFFSPVNPSLPTAGTFNVSCIITSSIPNCSANPSNVITVVVADYPNASISSINHTQCSITLGASPAGMSYLWHDNSTSGSFSTSSSGVYSVMVTEPTAGCSATADFTYQKPRLNLNPTLNSCFNASTGEIPVDLLYGTPAFTPYSLSWSGPTTGSIGGLTATTHNISNLSAGSYIVTVTDADGCTRTASTTVASNSQITANSSFTAATCQNSANGSATVSNPAGGLPPYNYRWHFNNSTSNSISGLLPGNYLVDVIDNVPCTTTVTVNVPFTNPALVANAGIDQIICANSSTILSGNIPTFGNGTWTIISGAGGNIAQPTNPSSSFSGVNGTAYTLRWTITGSPCPSASDNVQIIIRPVITPSVSITQTVGTNPMCAGASATFTATPTNGGTLPSFQWKINGGNVGTNSPIFTTTLLTNGQTVTCVMTSNATCVSTTPVPSNSITITVTPFILLDLFMKDNTIPSSSVEDDGTEPSPFTLIMANSQDIWVTVGNNPWVGAQNADFDQNPNHVWVTVRNRGCVDYTSGAQLHIYWAKASTALDWDSYWTADPVTGICHQTPASNGLTCGSSADCLGEEITDPVNGIPIPPIAAKSSTGLNPISTLWTVPNSNGFQSCMPLAYEHFCLVARIVYPTQDPMTFPEGSNIWSNTWQNNNIIWRNITIVSTIPGIQSGGNECIGDKPVGGVISVGNPFEDADVYQLDFKVDDNYTGLPIFEQAEIKVTLDEKTWDIWAAGGFQSDNFSIKREDCRQLVVTGSPATLKNLAYDRNDLSLIALSFNFLTDKVDQTPNFLYHVIQVRNENNDEIIGSETYQIGKPSRYLFGADGGGDKTISYTENIQLSASVIGEPAFYNWYDEEGNMIYTGENFTVSPEFTKKYKLEVIAQSDGFTSYDSVIVHVKEYEIINLSPNPASSQLTVEYEARKANSAYFTIVQPYTTTINNYIINPTLTTTTLNLSGYTPGNYFIRLICDGQIRDEKTLIIIQ